MLWEERSALNNYIIANINLTANTAILALVTIQVSHNGDKNEAWLALAANSLAKLFSY